MSGVNDKSKLLTLPGSETPPEPEEMKEKVHQPDDDELAQMVIELLGDNYAYFRGTWHKYQDGFWKPQKTIFPVVRDVLRKNRFTGIRISKSKCQSVEWLVQNDLEIEDEDEIDNATQYFNLKNGLFNLDTFCLEKHNKAVYITGQAGFAYDPKATAPVFEEWLFKMFITPEGKTDWGLINLAQEAIGYTLTGDTSFRVSFWVWGPTGSGKSTLLKLLIAMMEMYHEVLDLNQLGTNRFLLARVAGKRLVTFGEADASTQLADGMYKALVDNGGSVTADIKNRDPITFTPQCKVWWGMNNLPYVNDRSGAVDSRVIIIPMRNKIPKEQWDFRLDEKLRNELPGIFNWAIEGLKRLRQNKRFTYVAQVEAVHEEYRDSSDPYGTFLKDEQWCKLDTTGYSIRTNAGLLFNAFMAWAKYNGIRIHVSNQRIRREWERLHLKHQASGGKWYLGVQLTDHAEHEGKYFR